MAAASRARRSRASSRASGSRVGATADRAARLVDAGRLRRPARTSGRAGAPRLPAIEAAVDENPREPDLERPRLAIRADVAEDLDERVLDRFVGLGGIAQVLIGDARARAAGARRRARRTARAPRPGRRARRGRESRRRAASPPTAAARPRRRTPARTAGGARLGGRACVGVDGGPQVTTHRGITMRPSRLFTVYRRLASC